MCIRRIVLTALLSVVPQIAIAQSGDPTSIIPPEPTLEAPTDTPTPAGQTETPTDTATPTATPTPVILYGLLHSDGRLTDWPSRYEALASRTAEGQIVEVDGTDMAIGNNQATYDAVAHRAVPWQAEIDRRAAIDAKDRTAFTACADFQAGKAALDAIDADVSQLASMTDAQLGSIASLRAVLRTMGPDIGRLSRIDRAAGKCLAILAGNADPDATPTP